MSPFKRDDDANWQIDQTRAAGSLLGALVAIQLGAPIVDTLPGLNQLVGNIIVSVTYVAVLATSTWVLAERKASQWIAVLLCAPPVVLIVLEYLAMHNNADLFIGISILPVVAMAWWRIMSHLLRGRAVTVASLIGTAAGFLLMSNLWAGLYALVMLDNPGAIHSADGSDTNFNDLIYFSMVTQTTLGYGDVVPISRLARALASLQAFAGLFFMGVIVARFAGRLAIDDS
ncbi:MAG: potassium channel family protein [Planctomycetota bacterium]